jgi:hypothetical protein
VSAPFRMVIAADKMKEKDRGRGALKDVEDD